MSAVVTARITQAEAARADAPQDHRPQNAVTLTSNVTATVTTGANLPQARGDAAGPGSGDTGSVCIGGTNVPLDIEPAKTFVADCARHTEGLIKDQELKEAWGLDEQQWVRLAENIPLLLAIKAERERRIRSGEAARQAAQRHFAKAPSILNEILHNRLISPRHRIEAAKELRHVAGNGLETSPAAEKYIINIDLGGDHKVRIETEIVPKPHTVEEEKW
jgi:hypothetical protein